MSSAANPKADQFGKADSDPSVPQESTGAIASDALAAESMKSGGGFSENDNAHILGVKGASSTLANEDTSGATTLHASEDGSTREKEDALGMGSDEKGVSGIKYPEGAGSISFSGTHTSEGYAGGPSSDREAAISTSSTGASAANDSATGGTSTATGGSSFGQSSSGDIDSSQISSSGAATSSESTGTSSTATDSGATGTSASGTGTDTSGASTTETGATGVRPHVDQAPNAFASIQSSGQMKPKGANLTEGDIPETKTFTGDVGGPHDPGRVAEREMLQGNQAQAGEGVGGIRQRKDEMTGSTGQYDVLQPERSDMQDPVGEQV